MDPSRDRTASAPDGDRSAEHDPPGALLSALTTEHFVLQSMAATTTNEAGTRCSLYLMSLSSSLVAFGFATQASHRLFAVFAGAVLPTLFLLGCFTVNRLVDTTITNIRCLRQIARIRGYYAGLDGAGPYFPTAGGEGADSLHMMGIRGARGLMWFTMASVVGIVNAVVAGSGIAIGLIALGMPIVVGVPCGIVVAAACVIAAIVYQRHRIRAAFPANDDDC